MNECPSLFVKHQIYAILAFSILFKLGLLFWTGDRVYGDVNIAIIYGKEYAASLSGAHGGLPVIHNKTAAGPVLWYWIYDQAGIPGIKSVNFICFLALSAIHLVIGQKIYPPGVVSSALVLFSFYPGTHLNVAAGEQDDMVSALLIAMAVLLYLNKKRPFAASLLMGCGFLFKFSAAVFWLGFATYLMMERRWKALLLSTAGVAIPLLFLSAVDNLNAFETLIRSLMVQKSYSTWGEVGFKLISTGMAVSAIVSLWVVTRKYDRHDVLFFWMSTTYLFYVLAMQDAYAAGYVMMLCTFFASFLIAEFLLRCELLKKLGRRSPLVLLLAYLLITTAITVHNLLHDTVPLGMGM